MVRVSGPHRLLLAVLGLALLASGCGQATPAARPPGRSPAPTAPPGRVAQVQRGTLSSTLSSSGTVQARQQVGVVPRVAGRVTKLHVDVGSEVRAGDVLLELESDVLAVQLAQVEAALAAAQARLSALEAGSRPEQVAQAEANLKAVRSRLAALEAGPRQEQAAIAAAGLDASRQRLAMLERGGRPEQVAQAEANLDAARARLDQVRKGATSLEIEQARLAVDQAKSALWATQTSRDGVCGNAYSPKYLCAAADAQVAAAETAVQQAEVRHAQARAGGTPEQVAQAAAAVRLAEEGLKVARRPASVEEVSQARDAVKVAEAQLALAKQPATEHDLTQARAAVEAAEQQLALVRQPATRYDLEIARAGVAQARAAVDLARLQLAEATVRAPFAGIVAQRLVSEGGTAGPTSPLLTVISHDVEVVVNVDESALATLQVGETATVTTSAYPDEQFQAIVAGVAPTVDARSRTLQVRLAPVDGARKLRDGMSAQAQLTTGGKEAVLLVPRAAIAQQSGEPAVYVVNTGRVQRRVVQLGAAAGGQVEVVAGLVEGERVAVSGLSGLRDGQEVATQ